VIEAPEAPEAPIDTAPQTTVTELLSGILDDAQLLVRQQFNMLKSEFHEDLRHTKQAMLMAGIGMALSTIGGISLVFCVVNVLNEQLHLKMWVSWGILGGTCFLAGIILALVAKNVLDKFNPLPDKTFNALQENLSWKTK
jgi:uncharacterized membrane protein YqjE